MKAGPAGKVTPAWDAGAVAIAAHPLRNSSKDPHSVATSICQKLLSTCVTCCHERSAAGLGRQDG